MIRKYHNHKLQTHHGSVRKSHTTIMRHQEDKQSKAARSLFLIEMIAKPEWNERNAQQNIEQLQNLNGSYNKQACISKMKLANFMLALL